VWDEATPIFSQISEQLADQIADGELAEGERVPSSNELAAFYRINPATAAKGINVLINEGFLEKRRGVGMFVVNGARQRLIDRRRQGFAEQFVSPLIAEATRLGINSQKLLELITRSLSTTGGSK
jgi:GntR family transcriptional regulator